MTLWGHILLMSETALEWSSWYFLILYREPHWYSFLFFLALRTGSPGRSNSFIHFIAVYYVTATALSTVQIAMKKTHMVLALAEFHSISKVVSVLMGCCMIRPPDGCSLALCTSPAWPASATPYSHDWPSYILVTAQLVIVLIFRSEHPHHDSFSKGGEGRALCWFPW